MKWKLPKKNKWTQISRRSFGVSPFGLLFFFIDDDDDENGDYSTFVHHHHQSVPWAIISQTHTHTNRMAYLLLLWIGNVQCVTVTIIDYVIFGYCRFFLLVNNKGTKESEKNRSIKIIIELNGIWDGKEYG